MTSWRKAYRGPFTLKGGEEIIAQLKKVADPDKNGIYDAKIRPTKIEGMYDIYLKLEKEDCACGLPWRHTGKHKPHGTDQAKQ